MKAASILLIAFLLLLCNCTRKGTDNRQDKSVTNDSLIATQSQKKDESPTKIEIKKKLLYDKYTLEDSYPYKDTTRQFQWEKIKERLTFLESIQKKPARWAILQNYKNLNGEAPLVKIYRRNEYKRISDTLGIERYQSVPLYLPDDTLTPERYGQDGSLVRFINEGPRFTEIEVAGVEGKWMVPIKYVKPVSDSVYFGKAIFVDRTNQNIATLEKTDSAWLIRSMNPATTGQHKPPYAQKTPLGIFVIQDKKTKMVYLADGSKETGGFAPYASRFTDGGYIHGVPVNAPRTGLIEFSSSLGTTPRSHMCVRNATSHAKFIFDWAPVNESIVFVLD